MEIVGLDLLSFFLDTVPEQTDCSVALFPTPLPCGSSFAWGNEKDRHTVGMGMVDTRIQVYHLGSIMNRLWARIST